MKHVGMFEAKTRLSSLVEEVETKGRQIVITRHGKPVAKLIAIGAEPALDRKEPSPDILARRRRALARLQEIAQELKINPTHEEIKSWINEGRR
jgi:prevent-host-death family protein